MSMTDLVEREERPAYVRFETRAVADKQATLEAGQYVAKNEDWALITPPYSRDCVEQKVKNWFINLEDNVKNSRIPAGFLKMYRDAYEAWKDGQDIPLNGTSIKNWAAISPADVKNILNAGCKTIEDLAAANDEGLRRIGMGAVNLKEKAAAYLSSASSVVEENAALKTEMGQLKGTIEAMQAQMDMMVKQGAQNVAPAAEVETSEQISISDIITPIESAIVSDKPAPKAKFGTKTVQDPKLVTAYIDKFGKKPHHMTKDEGIRKKLEE